MASNYNIPERCGTVGNQSTYDNISMYYNTLTKKVKGTRRKGAGCLHRRARAGKRLLRSGCQAIAAARFGQQITRARGVVLDFFAQAAQSHVQAVLLCGVLLVVALLQRPLHQALAGTQLARVILEVAQQV